MKTKIKRQMDLAAGKPAAQVANQRPLLDLRLGLMLLRDRKVPVRLKFFAALRGLVFMIFVVALQLAAWKWFLKVPTTGLLLIGDAVAIVVGTVIFGGIHLTGSASANAIIRAVLNSYEVIPLRGRIVIAVKDPTNVLSTIRNQQPDQTECVVPLRTSRRDSPAASNGAVEHEEHAKVK